MTAKLLFFATLSLLNMSVTVEKYRAYVLGDLPVLHFLYWKENSIPFYINDCEILGDPIPNHFVP